MAGASKKRQLKERHQKQDDKGKDKSGDSSSLDKSSPTSQRSPPAGWDGNRDPARTGRPEAVAVRQNVTTNRNVDFGIFATRLATGGPVESRGPVPQRPGYNTSGNEIDVQLNTFEVQKMPEKTVYQFDVLIGNGAERRALNQKVWKSKEMQKRLGQGWIYDGNRLAWSLQNKEEMIFDVNLDEENGRPPRTDPKTGEVKHDKKGVKITQSKKIDFSRLRDWLEKRTDWNNECYEAISFCDHLMRESPSQKLLAIKRNFFSQGDQRYELGMGVEAFKGTYASLKPVNNGSGSRPSVTVTVDVANTAFWTQSELWITARAIMSADNGNHLARLLEAGKSRKESVKLKALNKRLRKLDVHQTVGGRAEETGNGNGNGNGHSDPPFKIDKLLNQNAYEYKFKQRDQATGREKETSIYDYFRTKHGFRLEFPDLPVIQTTKKHIVLPMEVCIIASGQRYPFKLNDKQTANMIKFAVTLPNERWQGITKGLSKLDWANDMYLRNYGLQITTQPTTVKARVLPNPKVQFGGGPSQAIDPRTTGRWDLRGKKFYMPHPAELKSWAVCIVNSRTRMQVNKENVQAFIRSFIQIFRGHGGKVQNTSPPVIEGGPDPAKCVEETWNTGGNQVRMKPQLLVFVVPDKNAETYNRIKKSCDCRYGVVSQVLQSAHVQKNQGQYISNVCMKVNAKLGGCTSLAVSRYRQGSWFKKPTMVIGADISHGGAATGPGDTTPSIASMTVSWDKTATRFAAGVQTNGIRTEIVAKNNIDTVLRGLVQEWIKQVSNGYFPQHVIYVRDGVSEGQYEQVLDQEVRDMREMFSEVDAKAAANVKFTVIVASKRHHVRFFPGKGGDRNGNPQPGTLVEKGVTNPFEFDFYLCSHSAIKGTARPVHYYVLLNECGLSIDEIENWIYETSYQYVRSTTPVSIAPAAYYAHQAAGRGMAHINKPSVSSGEKESESQSTQQQPTEVPELLPLRGDNGILYTMWYV